MLEKILIPVDGTPRSEAVLWHLARLLRGRESQVVFLRVIEPILGYPGVETGAIVETERAEAKAYFKELKERLPARDARVTGLIREGYPADVILHVAKEERATLIAMGTHGRTGIARWAWGSVAEDVLRRADVPVLLTRSDRSEGAGWIPASPEEAPFRRLLVPTDGSEAAAAALPVAAAVAREFGAEIVALHVVPEHAELVMGHTAVLDAPPSPELGRRIAAEFVAPLTDEGLKTRAEGVAGDAGEKILETAARDGADLIVMGTHGRSGLARLGLGSVTERVLRGATVPMLVVRASTASARRRKLARGAATS